MQILVCVKRVPMVGGKIVILPNGQELDTHMSGFTVSPHEECAVEEAVRLAERYGGGVTVLALGPAEAADQLRDMLALGASLPSVLVAVNLTSFFVLFQHSNVRLRFDGWNRVFDWFGRYLSS